MVEYSDAQVAIKNYLFSFYELRMPQWKSRTGKQI